MIVLKMCSTNIIHHFAPNFDVRLTMEGSLIGLIRNWLQLHSILVCAVFVEELNIGATMVVPVVESTGTATV